MDLGLMGKVAVVTKGLGKAFAHELGKEGAQVSICARNKQDLEQTALELRERGVRVIGIEADVTSPQDIARVVDRTIAELGGIDILVNNAGDTQLNHVLNTTDEEWRYTMDVDLYSAVRFTRKVVPHMRKRGGGHIINISSAVPRTAPPVPIYHDYVTAKAGLLAFSKAVSFELAPDNILLNCVCPGFSYSALEERLANSAISSFGKTRDEVVQNIANQFVALKRFARPDEMSGLVTFLASERASYITGSVYDIDGGFQKSL